VVLLTKFDQSVYQHQSYKINFWLDPQKIKIKKLRKKWKTKRSANWIDQWSRKSTRLQIWLL